MSMTMEGSRGSRVEMLPVSWGKWERCVMWRRRESITGKQICGFGWMRREGFYEDPNRPGYEMGQLEQFAKNKKEIFKFKLKEPEVIKQGLIDNIRVTKGRGGRKYA
jgi:hypothetical protein